jgi:hypothetical protein
MLCCTPANIVKRDANVFAYNKAECYGFRQEPAIYFPNGPPGSHSECMQLSGPAKSIALSGAWWGVKVYKDPNCLQYASAKKIEGVAGAADCFSTSDAWAVSYTIP